jgi:hypothetical protein
MLIRVASVCLATLLLAACGDEDGKDQSKQASNICKGLSQTECAAKAECRWDTARNKCRRKKADDKAAEKPSPETTDQAPTPAPSPTPEAPPTPSAPEQTPAPETPQ